MASFHDTEVAVVTRTDADELTEGLFAFSGARYREAIDTLETYIGRLPENASAPYARYVLGLSYLNAAGSDFLGRAHQVDAALVERGLYELSEAERTTESRRIREDAQWFLANGHLLNLDVDAALASLEKVEAQNGRRSSEAHALAEKIRVLRNDAR